MRGILSSSHEWRDRLRDIEFWLNPFRHRVLYNRLVPGNVRWNVGVGPMASFTRVISSIIVEAQSEELTKAHVIKVDLKPTATAEEALGRGITSIKFQRWRRTSGCSTKKNTTHARKGTTSYSTTPTGAVAPQELEDHVWHRIVPRINKRLSTERFLLVVEILQWPLDLGSFTMDVGLPPPNKNAFGLRARMDRI